jgi:hypothetical protein
MTTTLPAIPGLVRQGTPCARKHWNIIKTEHVIRYGLVFGRWCPASGVAQVLNLSNGVGLTEVAPDDLLVVLDDLTGFDHALLWLAEKLKMDGTKGLLWYRVERQDFDHGQHMPAHYLLQGHQWTWAFTEEVGDNAKYFFYGYKTADGWEKLCFPYRLVYHVGE